MRSNSTNRSPRARRALALAALFVMVCNLVPPARPLRVSARTSVNSDAHDSGAATQLSTEQARAAYGRVGMSFEENRGQTDAQVKFLARGGGYTLFLTETEAVFVIPRRSAVQDEERANPLSKLEAAGRASERAAAEPPPAVLRMKLEGANPQPTVSGVEELEGKVNYFKGNDPEKWRTDIPTFGRVHYESVYAGVDMVYYGNQSQLEYDFVVGPGADTNQIGFSFDGADGVEVDSATGDLLLKVGGETLRQHKPFVYQESNGERTEIESSYELQGGGRVGFRVGSYDHARPLVIDPVLAYSTFLNGSGEDIGDDIALDASGNAYVRGSTQSLNFPTANAIDPSYNGGNLDIFVTKLNAAGSSLVYSTFLGGDDRDNNGGGGIAVDSGGSAYVTGSTASHNFPTVNAFQSDFGGGRFDAFVTKLNPAGSALVYSTYLGGGTVNDVGLVGSDNGFGIAVDSANNAYVVGGTGSQNFPKANPLQATYGAGVEDAFVTKLDATGTSLVYSTFLGGDGNDAALGIVVDAAGNAYVTGQAGSNFPTANAIDNTFGGGNFDGFVAKLNPAGAALVYSTYLGGSTSEVSSDIAVDAAGNAYLTGVTTSNDFPTANAIDSTLDGNTDAFVTKLNASGSALVYSTYLGGNDRDNGQSVAVDAAGAVYVVGGTSSQNFPTTNAIDNTFGGNENDDVFVTKINPTGNQTVFSTYLGSGGDDVGTAITVDAVGDVYVAGFTDSPDFPVTPNAFQKIMNPSRSAFVSKIGEFAISFSISGRVVDTGGNPVVGATVILSREGSDTETTDGGGNFTFIHTTPGGNYTVTPVKSGFTFAPSSLSIGNLSSNQQLTFVGTSTAPTPTPTPTATPTPTQTPSTFQFSSSSFGVSEGAGSAEVIVTRAGDASQPATVEYATTDGTANDRGDYTTAIGRLRFGAGETAKSFRVFVTDDAYAEGNETVNVTLSNPSTGAQVGGSATVVLTIVDNDAMTASSNPIDNTPFFVRQHYVDFLGREPDSAGLAFWTNNIESCGANAGCREARRIDTSAAFFLSIEFQETGFLVEKAYRAAFNRFPSFREFIRDARETGRNVTVGQGAWQAQLESNKQTFFADFAARSDFLSLYGGLSNSQYVEALNANTGGSLSPAESGALAAGLNALTETRATVLRKVAENAAFTGRETNRAFVLMEYFGYLRRDPNAPPDTDLSGFNFWLGKLNSFGGDYRRAELVKAFIFSGEYRQRFGQ